MHRTSSRYRPKKIQGKKEKKRKKRLNLYIITLSCLSAYLGIVVRGRVLERLGKGAQRRDELRQPLGLNQRQACGAAIDN